MHLKSVNRNGCGPEYQSSQITASRQYIFKLDYKPVEVDIISLLVSLSHTSALAEKLKLPWWRTPKVFQSQANLISQQWH